MFRKQAACLGCSLALVISFYSSGVSANIESDPWEGINRSIYQFNKKIDSAFVKPLAQGYHAVTPDIIETGVHNFFSNLGDVTSLANNILQLKLDASLTDFSRIVFNSTFGLAGLIDVATPMGLKSAEEDFGQTLGYWGITSGPYVVLPLLGPSSVRDGLAKIPDSSINLWADEVDHIPTRNSGYAAELLDKRVGLFSVEKLISGDEYGFVRDAYLQQREFEVKDGQMDGTFNQDDF
ncbi:MULTISPECIES: VacJ family lipoprotein [Neptunomonas]|uniref:Phospholipid-binding lipoprotein MlaA n=1 Tax=Neptunomonas qingdaonensis TaxID=1045558 RepID=A0A1I2SXD3_9GAMM|nr:VacJ family lipoprotein [Neptunomonas qingdaonensis]SFG54836.1 phospholipid-binding lipoprotein MlaA [Neptunomonas qingdaonensis]